MQVFYDGKELGSCRRAVPDVLGVLLVRGRSRCRACGVYGEGAALSSPHASDATTQLRAANFQVEVDMGSSDPGAFGVVKVNNK